MMKEIGKMEYWRGIMNWPIELDWKCETCGDTQCLIWGLVHGRCRCARCHTQYGMRVDGKIVTWPVCMLKPEYKKAAQIGWHKIAEPISGWTDVVWDKFIEEAKEEIGK